MREGCGERAEKAREFAQVWCGKAGISAKCGESAGGHKPTGANLQRCLLPSGILPLLPCAGATDYGDLKREEHCVVLYLTVAQSFSIIFA